MTTDVDANQVGHNDGSQSPPLTGSATGVDWVLIERVMQMINRNFEDTDEGSAIARCTNRMLAEALGMPLEPFRLLKETKVKLLYRQSPNNRTQPPR